MKYLLILSFVVFCAYQSSSTEAAEIGLRSKRSLERGQCPENFTLEQCQASVEDDFKKDNDCAKLSSLHRDKDTGKIVYQIEGCAYEQCTYKGQNLEVIEDHSKDYPDCCAKCDLSGLPPGATKSADFSIMVIGK